MLSKILDMFPLNISDVENHTEYSNRRSISKAIRGYECSKDIKHARMCYWEKEETLEDTEAVFAYASMKDIIDTNNYIFEAVISVYRQIESYAARIVTMKGLVSCKEGHITPISSWTKVYFRDEFKVGVDNELEDVEAIENVMTIEQWDDEMKEICMLMKYLD